MTTPVAEIRELCVRALEGGALDEAALGRLLAADDEGAEELYAAAREQRARQFGDGVFLYGFVYFSTYCRNACAFCYYRVGNPESPRYRKTPDEVVAICRDLAASGVDLLDLTMGEDPVLLDDGAVRLVELVGAVVEATGLPVMVSPGVVDDAVLRELRRRGADWYALYQETHSPELYARLRVGQPFEYRAAARAAARAVGLLVEDGLLTGIGDGVADRAHSIAVMRAGDWQQVRVMTFVPQAGTPLAATPPPADGDELRAIAVMRLAMPDRLIPASLDVDGIRGLERRLQAGANVVTSIVPPTTGLAGVSQSELDIEEGHRTVAGVLPHLARLGLRHAGPAAYAAWVERARRRAAAGDGAPGAGDGRSRLEDGAPPARGGGTEGAE
ncbi:MAG: methylornithine synthase PylB [Thermoleophilia bacterium]|nr:methylornithine synthase PylB [Thermoleophilia bacterium]